jgi:Fe-S cluster assembly protein SufD
MIHFTDITKKPKKTYTISKSGEHVFFLFNTRGHFTFNITCEGAHVVVLGVFIGRSKENFELHTVQKHTAPRSRSELLVKGVFFDAARFVYSGLIQIEKAAQQTDAMQTNRNLLLSKQAIVKSEPYLEILADDVKCKHASTTGRVNQDQLYYAMTRGLSEEAARNAIAAGFIRDIFLKAEKLGIGDKVEAYKKKSMELLDVQLI